MNSTGQYYYNARWYDPNLGRFTTKDPIKSGLNWYAYANNNPLRFVDPTGLSDWPSNLLEFQEMSDYVEQNRLTPVYATQSGILELAQWNTEDDSQDGYGFFLVTENEDGTVTLYGHMDDKYSRQPDDEVETGDLLGYISDSSNGKSTGPHVHFEERDAEGNVFEPRFTEDLPVIGGEVTNGYGIEENPFNPEQEYFHPGVDIRPPQIPEGDGNE